MTAISHPASSLPRRLNLLARDIKLSHSVFALPFALLASFLAAGYRGHWPSTVELALVILCMFLARTFAMAVNRWADAEIDAANPRTAGRAIPRGELSPAFVLASALACAGGFLLAAAGFWLAADNPWPIILAPFVLLWIGAYSFAKRYTALSHLILGSALGLSPLAAAIAIEPAYLAQPAPYLLMGMVLCWVGGFDVIYALQDISIDRRMGLCSLPARLGAARALRVSRALHLGVIAALATLAWVSPQLETFFIVAGCLTAALLLLEHALVWGSKTHHIHLAFFTLNGLISLLLGAAGIVDVIRLAA